MRVARATTLLCKSGMMMAFEFEQANEILHHKANLNGYLAYHTGQPYETIVQDTDRDFFMSAKEAKEYGLIDAVISNPLKALRPLPEPVPA
ncbi:unnamed protein product [Sphagnum jensenii]|uniref:ATP-dependent Clp protease proteolytic subunit n=1 Tax=Sphagnum jensenii TaxID=128206 RepID=A0ABP0XGC4_9BRYO